MKSAVLCGVFCLAIGGCGSAAQSPPALQRYQSLKSILAAVTDDTGRVASDSSALARALNSLQSNRVRGQAAVLKRDALRLEDDAGRLAAGVRPLLPGSKDTHVRAYFRLVLTSLSAGWAEAYALTRLASILPGDPWLSAPANARSFNRLEGAARVEARLAVRDAALAAALKRRYPRSFLYVPVRPSRGTQAATSPHGSK